MQVTLLGTGTSQGVPVIGCTCEVCCSTDPRDSRLRCAVHIKSEQTDLVIDIGPDFRQQMLRLQPSKLDAVLLTHEHTDHMIGLDDIRPFNFMQRKPAPLYATSQVQTQLKARFSYAFQENPYPGAPSFDLHTISPTEDFTIGDLKIIPIPVMHGNLPVLGFRMNNFAYITDANFIPPRSMELLEGLDCLVLNALHHNAHHSHFNLVEALDQVKALAPMRAYFTHISHNMGLTSEIESKLPDNISLAYDGLQFNC